MTETILDDADGSWQVRGFVGDEWQWHIGPHKPFTTPGWLAAHVPGSVLDDLHRAGEIPDPYVGRNSLLNEWVPNRNWAYRRTFTLSALGPHERAVLCFDGVDHEATVLVDDTVVARHEGMFRPFEADITHLVRDGGEHLLAVVVHPAPVNEPQVGRTDRVRVHKARMGYGWDFCPPMVHQGIWRGVRLVVSGPARLRSVTASASLGPGAEGLHEGTVRIEADLTLAEAQRAPDGTRLAVRVRDADRVVAEAERDLTGMTADTGAHIELSVPRPRLWWPNGAGEQHLHEVEVTFTSGPHTTTRRFQVGFRRVELVPNEGAPEDALPYTLTVNGRRLYANGWNWVPIDAQYGVPRPAKLAHLLGMARAAHVNLLRVWGGGLLETEEFYALCDRLGLMVWQEFSMSSSGMASTPASDPEFVDLMVREAHAVVPARRHHPSLVLWCGGNELQDEKGNPLDESAPVLRALRDAVGQLDPERAWLPSSPSGVEFLNRADNIARNPDGLHDVHGPWEHQGLAEHNGLYDSGTCLLHSEFGVEGMANRRTLEHLVPDEADRWPAGRENPVYAHLGAWWNNAPLVQDSFGARIDDVDTMRRASQHLQYDGLRYALEANRRRAFRSSGTLPWQFNEPVPNAWCTAAVDHRGDPKPVYHGVRRAYRPLHVCAAFTGPAWGGRETVTAEVWAWATESLPAGTVVARIVDVHGTEAARHSRPLDPAASEEPGRPLHLGTLSAPLEAVGTDVFFLDLALYDTAGTAVAGNRYVCSRTCDLAPLLDLPPARIEAVAEPHEDGTGRGRIRLRHVDGPAAPGLVLEDARPYGRPGWAVFGDNVIDLLPGEETVVDVEWRAAPPDDRVVRISGWNVGVHLVR
ncbi:glycoside hydrolase family 2 protein [Streptomyces spiralis]|uniref:glycoside hydrolase family 2 protein n=1 Tax=Streptomyces spiralis TaxID=66376 RepID=UPI0036C1BDCF